MVELREHLRQRRAAVLERWLEDSRGAYAKQTSRFLKREKNRFANPVGHHLRVGSEAILDAVLGGREASSVEPELETLIKIKAVQDFAPSKAIAFVLRLKQALRAELGNLAGEARHAADLHAIEEAVDEIALVAFDLYVQCREQIFELRVNELKRGVSALWGRLGWDQPETDPDPADEDPSSGGGIQ